MNFIARAFLPVLLLIAALPMQSEAEPVREFDILGIKLGTTADEVKKILTAEIPDITIEPQNKEIGGEPGLVPLGYRSPTVLSGMKALSSGKDPFTGKVAKGILDETIMIVFDLSSHGTTIGIRRHKLFDVNAKPSVKAIRDALESKFGKPDLVDERQGDFFWFLNTSEKHKTLKGLRACQASVPVMIDMAEARFSYSNKIPGDCGTIFMASIYADVTNPLVARETTYHLLDYSAGSKSADYVMKLIKDGVQEDHKEEERSGDKVKLKL